MWASLTLTALLATSAFATPFKGAGGFCGSNPTQDEVMAAEKHFLANKVVFHIFYDEKNPSDGYVRDSVIYKQMAVIEPFFEELGLNFNLKKINRRGIPNATFYGADIGNTAEATIKKYREGDVATLNIYTVGGSKSGAAGWATFPWDYKSKPQLDGVVMDYNFIPEGKHADYNTGKITVHEIGHWIGLYHTFQGGCNGGDQVGDTPAEAFPGRDCPVRRDTCPSAGDDPIDNMMDYTNDNCRVRFTDGQYARAAQVLTQYRNIDLLD